MSRKIAVVFLLVLSFSLFAFRPAAGMGRNILSIDSIQNFSWNPSFKIGDSALTFSIGCPIRLSVSGLCDKVLCGESLPLNVAVDSISGAYFGLGGRTFSLDGLLALAQSKIEKIDLRPVEDLMLHSATLITGWVAGAAAAGTVSLVGKLVIDNTEMWIMNELEVDAVTSGPATVSNSVLRTWFGKSTTMTLQIGQVAQRGLSAAIGFMSRWVMRFHFDFKQSLYSHPLIGGILRKIRDTLRLPWEPALGTSSGSSTPSTSSRILLPDFGIQTMSSTQTITQGETTQFRIQTTSIDEFDSTVHLSVQGVPSGATGFFNPSEVTPTAETVLTVQTDSGISPGRYTLTLIGEADGKQHQVSVQLMVNARPQIRTTDVRVTPEGWTPGLPSSSPWQQTPLVQIIVIVAAAVLIGLVYTASKKKTSQVRY